MFLSYFMIRTLNKNETDDHQSYRGLY